MHPNGIFPLTFAIKGGVGVKEWLCEHKHICIYSFQLTFNTNKTWKHSYSVKFYSKVPELKMTSISKKRKMQEPNKRKTGNWNNKVVSSLFLST